MGLLCRRKGFLSWDTQKDFFLKSINGAPNLERLEGHFDPKILKALPQDKYFLVETLELFISSDVEEKRCVKLAKAQPRIASVEFEPERRQKSFQ